MTWSGFFDFQARERAAAGLVVVAEPADHADVALPQAASSDPSTPTSP
jgi:hypothetical protein